ncbi:sarcosine oxidase subunit beta family protein [Sphingopyxis sp. RIFCSPHIGHO2_12_FULL_65_19]|uniref:sarcosine oxidase subunit beta family protein n=1 Tax=Sphingopyxis sp. RIFCSPHIGHO2_12_FULL_65_19 TaxID=1802172 RepID=UPI0008C28814|nr:sarcosine oxidase subunit beta family protein [Sphingopyxis sp. RIFCSPHIGHO2_12_FULL_65_19]OHD09904.1 MAG: sarcosine oxidase subunit beta [Sphingopyxis sp. RIFCSPHIGHO2_12_FULL_65_19]
MTRYSAWSLVRAGFSGQRTWAPAWRDAAPRKRYQAVIIGGGGHGLATAYYLARKHGIRDIAVLERGWIGGGNTGRNTTVIRSNYFFPQSARFYDFALTLYEGLSRELNYNIMFSQRGMWSFAHDRHGVEMLRRSVNAMQLNGVDAEYHDGDTVRRRIPGLNPSPRFPILAGLLQPRGGTARHDAVAWGYARAADGLGVDIIQNCDVTGFDIREGRVVGVQTTRGNIATECVGMAVAGHSGVMAERAGFRLPIISYALQAFVSEPLKPVLDTVVLAPSTGTYLSQSDKGELVIGSALDLFPSYAQRGSLPVLEQTAAGLIDLFPQFSRVRLLRQWAGIVDVVSDSTPILGESPVKGLYLNCGWGTGGFKAIPAGGFCLAHHMATGAAHPLAAAFSLDRFRTGALIDEAAASGIAH